MSSNAPSSWRLYVILDRGAAGARPLTEVASAALRGGADALQLRDKRASSLQLREEARYLLPLARTAGVPLIINDDPEAVLASGADGVHLGQEDAAIADARRLLGPGRLIGKSTHSLEQATAAHAEGADYIGFGPIFPTPTKPAYTAVGTRLIHAVVSRVPVPVVCIGGIDCSTAGSVIAAGARCLAAVRAVCGADDPADACRALKSSIENLLLQSGPPSYNKGP